MAAVLVPANHPPAGKASAVRQFAATPRVTVRLPSGVHERIDEALDVPFCLKIPPLLEAVDSLAVPPSTTRLHWRRRFHADAAIAWLRQSVIDDLAGH